MNIKMKAISFLWLVFCLAQPAHAQQAIVTTGGDLYTTSGSVAYSVGQVAFTSPANEVGSISQGVQQPFQLSIVGISELHWVSMFELYPNPANQNLYLHATGSEQTMKLSAFQARIFDMLGNLVATQKLQDDVNMISVSALPTATYFIQIWQENTFIQSVSFSKIN